MLSLSGGYFVKIPKPKLLGEQATADKIKSYAESRSESWGLSSEWISSTLQSTLRGSLYDNSDLLRMCNSITHRLLFNPNLHLAIEVLGPDAAKKLFDSVDHDELKFRQDLFDDMMRIIPLQSLEDLFFGEEVETNEFLHFLESSRSDLMKYGELTKVFPHSAWLSKYFGNFSPATMPNALKQAHIQDDGLMLDALPIFIDAQSEPELLTFRDRYKKENDYKPSLELFFADDCNNFTEPETIAWQSPDYLKVEKELREALSSMIIDAYKIIGQGYYEGNADHIRKNIPNLFSSKLTRSSLSGISGKDLDCFKLPKDVSERVKGYSYEGFQHLNNIIVASAVAIAFIEEQMAVDHEDILRSLARLFKTFDGKLGTQKININYYDAIYVCPPTEIDNALSAFANIKQTYQNEIVRLKEGLTAHIEQTKIIDNFINGPELKKYAGQILERIGKTVIPDPISRHVEKSDPKKLGFNDDFSEYKKGEICFLFTPKQTQFVKAFFLKKDYFQDGKVPVGEIVATLYGQKVADENALKKKENQWRAETHINLHSEHPAKKLGFIKQKSILNISYYWIDFNFDK